MHDYDIQTTLETLGRTFETFKETHEERMEKLEKKGDSTPLAKEKLEKLEENLEQTKSRLEKMETLFQRPLVETQSEPFCGHQRAFLDYLCKGVDTSLLEYEQKSLSTTSDGDGGYLVPSGLHDHLYTTLQEKSVMRGLAHIREISTSALEMLIDKETADAGWVAETEDRPETQTPQLAKIQIPAHEMYARPRATQKLLDDARLNVEDWLSQKIVQKMSMMEKMLHGKQFFLGYRFHVFHREKPDFCSKSRVFG